MASGSRLCRWWRGEKMATWRLKSCPRCVGDTFIEKDIDGWIERCLLCGYSRELVEAEKAVIATSREKK